MSDELTDKAIDVLGEQGNELIRLRAQLVAAEQERAAEHAAFIDRAADAMHWEYVAEDEKKRGDTEHAEREAAMDAGRIMYQRATAAEAWVVELRRLLWTARPFILTYDTQHMPAAELPKARLLDEIDAALKPLAWTGEKK